jgi:hypothetical protein
LLEVFRQCRLRPTKRNQQPQSKQYPCAHSHHAGEYNLHHEVGGVCLRGDACEPVIRAHIERDA